jgi:hypothetical protein
MPQPSPSLPTFQSWVGKNIKEICTNEYINNAHNHCAHFVAHAKGYAHGYTCFKQTGKGTGPGASIRVNELFMKCPEVGTWDKKSTALTSCLAFITNASNVDVPKKAMTDHPQKHIGIFDSGLIYHYSNGDDKVISDTPAAFERKFKQKYSGPAVTLFYGKFPL